MRLLNIDTRRLETFQDDRIAPPYVILSHTWGSQEATLQDAVALAEAGERLASIGQPGNTNALEEFVRTSRRVNDLQGWHKIVSFCNAIRKRKSSLHDFVQHAWVDTCCIDKTSSAELSEAINSMFRWYREAVACFVLLEDFDISLRGFDASIVVGPDFERSRWFTRGWTLQEMLAPRMLYLFDKEWRLIGDKDDLAPRLSRRTGIEEHIIRTGSMDGACVAQRMSWAATRDTTRSEDIAYCLLGIFDVNMPLLYGEGSRAFKRLQEEILKETNDHSILAWDASNKDKGIELVGVLADHPSQFHACSDLEAIESTSGRIGITHGDVDIRTSIIADGGDRDGFGLAAILECRNSKDMASRIAIPIRSLPQLGLVPRGQKPPARYGRTHRDAYSLSIRGPHPSRSAGIFLIKRDMTTRPSGRTIRRCWLHYEDIRPWFQPVVSLLSGQWVESLARSMTVFLPTSSDAHHVVMWGAIGAPILKGSTRLCVVVRIVPSQRCGSVSLHLINESDSEIETLQTHLSQMMQSMRYAGAEARNRHSTLCLEVLQARLLTQVDLHDDNYCTLEVSISKESTQRTIK